MRLVSSLGISQPWFSLLACWQLLPPLSHLLSVTWLTETFFFCCFISFSAAQHRTCRLCRCSSGFPLSSWCSFIACTRASLCTIIFICWFFVFDFAWPGIVQSVVFSLPISLDHVMIPFLAYLSNNMNWLQDMIIQRQPWAALHWHTIHMLLHIPNTMSIELRLSCIYSSSSWCMPRHVYLMRDGSVFYSKKHKSLNYYVE